MRRIDEALAHMQSKAWLCGPSKVAMRHDALTIAALPPDFTKRYEIVVRRAVKSVLERGKEGVLLLTNRRSSTMSSAAATLSKLGREVQLATKRIEGIADPALDAYAFEAWRAIERDPARRVSLDVTIWAEDGAPTEDELLFTGVSPAYPDWHPRHFPVDALAATKMSTINAIAAAVSARIYAEAGLRAGGEYSTGFFLADPFEAARRGNTD